jgi:Ca-activated chloride channel homolog
MQLMQGNGFSAQRLVIDVSGDGRDADHAALDLAKTAARFSGVTVNGLPIESEDQGLTAYYRAQVITGANSFVVRAANFEDYVAAFREKLLEELRPLGS